MKATARAALALDGLSVGDALGERFFGPPAAVVERIAGRQLPPATWLYTDDTEMALSVFTILRDRGAIDQDELARRFASGMGDNRGYGRGAYELLWGVRRGESWHALSHGAFGYKGSYGNGAAMRVAPLGAFFADDIDRCVAEAELQAEVTHAHSEGIAGSIAVAVAAATAWNRRHDAPSPASFLTEICARVPDSATREGIARAIELAPTATLESAVRALGNGSEISAPDTVPICLWVAARHLDSYPEAFWEMVAALGDRDTTCAIVGGIVALSAGRQSIPTTWLASREALPV